MLEQDRHVLDALAQRRDVHADHVETEEQILAEVAGGDLLRQIAVGRRDQPHVDAGVRAVRADALDLAGLKEAQEHHLHAGAHLADFVEEDGAVRRHLQQSGFVAIRAGEAAAYVAEELRLEQRIGQAGAVDRDQPARAARALRSWIRRATTSLPTPVSPVMSTLAPERAAQSISVWMVRTASLRPSKRTSELGTADTTAPL